MYPYNAGGKIGISLQLAGVQIIELAKRGDGDMGFGNEGDGFIRRALQTHIFGIKRLEIAAIAVRLLR